MTSRAALPIDSHLAEIVTLVAAHRAAVITAAPGAGKTTRVPPALAGAGPVLVLQPRRVAARAMAARVADENGWTLGREVGWHVRFDRRASRDTRILFATEGILTARLLSDPLLGDFATIVIDEFHERSIHADVGLALAKQAWLAREDLRLVVMSATIDADRVAAYLSGAPVIRVEGRAFPVAVSYQPGQSIEDAVVAAMPASGAALCFLPGAGEIARAMTSLRAARFGGPPVEILPLHGGLGADEQDAAIRPSSSRRVILATNLAETTVTVPDVSVVIDSGVHKVARYDAERGVDRLVTERIPNDSAEQRAGRAGRVREGRAVRLWDARDRLREHREAEIHRIDLAATLLDVMAWGGDPWTSGAFDWYEAPPRHAVDSARALLFALGAIGADGRLTPLGAELRSYAVHPRLARILVADEGSVRAARAAAWLSEGGRATDVDIATIVESPDFPRHLDQLARSLMKPSSGPARGASGLAGDDERFRRAVFAGYPDRLARRREVGSDRFVLASGTGARLARGTGALSSEFVVALEVRSVEGAVADARAPRVRPPGEAEEPRITIASPVDAAWIVPTSREVAHTFDPAARKVRAARIERYGALVLSAHPVAADPAAAVPLAFAAWRARARTADELQTLARLRFAAAGGAAAAAAALADLAADAAPPWVRTSDSAGNPLGELPADVARALDRAAPATLRVPSGRERPLEYREEAGAVSVVASVKLQELFGLADTPVIGAAKVPVTFELLAPNGRPVQVTRDLKSFWARGYPEVRKELRGRYPRHPWPDDPWTATPTARTKRR